MSMIEHIVQQAKGGLHENDEARKTLTDAAEVAGKLNANIEEARDLVSRAKELLQDQEYAGQLMALLGNASLSADSSAKFFDQATDGSILPSAESLNEAAIGQKNTIQLAALGALTVNKAVEQALGNIHNAQNSIARLFRLSDLFDLSAATDKNQAVQAHGEQFIADLAGGGKSSLEDFDFEF